jgi:serine/threonine-protein kinase
VGEDGFAEGLVGIVLDGRYRLDAVLGEGGMGAVFRAHHLAMDRKVAVKLLKPHLTNDDAALQRFAREARVTMRVDSPHAVKLLDFGVTPQRDYYMVLEYVDGRTVQRELDVDGAFAPRRVLHIARQALHALAAAHASGLVHRDIKPENMLLSREGDDADFTKLLDFGVAKLMEGAARSDRSKLAITAAGMVFGTPEYMSPEQACGLPLDPRSDLYSLAATMFAMLTGCALYRASSALEWLTLHATEAAPHLAEARPELAAYPELDQLLQRCLLKRRDARPQDANELARLIAELEPTLDRAPAAAPPAASMTVHALPTSQSAYIEALPTTTGALVASRARRGLWLGLGALVVAGMIAAAVAIAVRGKEAGPRTSELGLRTATDAAIARNVAPTDAAPLVAEVPRDAAVAHAPPESEVRSPKPEVPNPAIAHHIAAAESAGHAKRWLVELEEADAALRLDPHDVRARYLIGDALLGSGDLEHGCKYLRDLGRNPTARARAHQAGCPGD